MDFNNVKYDLNIKGYNFKMFKCNGMSDSRINTADKMHSLRDDFSRDRDRIMYSKAFRRLNGKTQIFLAGKDDHARNRLTHTLEVSQIARTMAKALGLSETLVEAIALGHDIGHTPFGHVGERTLNEIVSGCYSISGYNDINIIDGYLGFKHNWQSIKVATIFTEDLKLTRETLWGMLNHSKKEYKSCAFINTSGKKRCGFRPDRSDESNNDCVLKDKDKLSYYNEYKIYKGKHLKRLVEFLKDEDVWSVEGYIVAIADEIAQRHHDLEDAIEYKLISQEDIVKKIEEVYGDCLKEDSDYYTQEGIGDTFKNLKFYEENKKNFEDLKGKKDLGNKEEFLGALSRFIVNLLTSDVIHNTASLLNKLINKHKLTEEGTFEENRGKLFEDFSSNSILMSKLMKEYDKKLQQYLKDRILNSYDAQRMDGIGAYIIRELFKAYIVNPQQLPDKSIAYIFNNYYKLKYGCNYRELLKEKKLMDNKDKYDIGEMRIKLKDLHFANDDNMYKISLVRTICDYIAGMTDKYAMDKHRELYNIKYE